MQLTRRRLVQSAALAVPSLAFGATAGRAESEAAEISRDSAAALSRLYRVAPKAAALRSRAAGVLIFPRIVKAGFVFGGQGGKGELRVGGRARGYYVIAAASFGLQAGVEWFSYALFFMNQDALRYLDKSDGWAVGTDPNVVVVNQGIANTFNTTTLAKNVVAFPFDQKGLMGDISLQGSKITRYNPST